MDDYLLLLHTQECNPLIRDRLNNPKLIFLINVAALIAIIDVVASTFWLLFTNLWQLNTSSIGAFITSLDELRPAINGALTTVTQPSGASSASNHLMILIAVSIATIIMMPHLSWSTLKDWNHSYFKTLMLGGLMISVHELMWYLAYIVMRLPKPTYMLTSTFFDLGLTVVILYYFLYGFKSTELKFVLAVGSFYVFWCLIGFPITSNFAGLTAYFGNPYVSLVEIGSWVWTLVVGFILLRRKE